LQETRPLENRRSQRASSAAKSQSGFWIGHFLEEPRFGSAYLRFTQEKKPEIKKEYQAFCHSESDWLDDFALFMAIKEDQGALPASMA
jgi:hypothetical protein